MTQRPTPQQAPQQTQQAQQRTGAAYDVDPGTLSLAELRGYRARLREEEDRVSYWRRVVHARTDLIEAGRDTSGGLGLDQVERALGETGSGARREALLRVRAFDPLPELPVLAEIWQHDGDPAATVARLGEASEQLSAYRTALHRRIDAATEELVARYHREPALALALLPGSAA
ncbi:hypothetical protein JOE61_001389 [Nocardioides salarius]|uniref:RsiG-like domain-containing protein n=1 Tax=Nocardioides salarius TaxID=374513 RepID=A0ABS2M8S8_9ACTN|nr:hypothetical protein [Nocardioides salarius]MBM7507575.1 hypothetical protein [Nocardioides salarius]